jgi:hypothetical protein
MTYSLTWTVPLNVVSTVESDVSEEISTNKSKVIEMCGNVKCMS